LTETGLEIWVNDINQNMAYGMPCVSCINYGVEFNKYGLLGDTNCQFRIYTEILCIYGGG